MHYKCAKSIVLLYQLEQLASLSGFYFDVWFNKKKIMQENSEEFVQTSFSGKRKAWGQGNLAAVYSTYP